MEEELIEQRERPAHRLADRVHARVAAFGRRRLAPFGQRRLAGALRRPSPALVGAVILGILLSDVAVAAWRAGRVRTSVLAVNGLENEAASADRLPAIGRLDGSAPYVIYAVENAANDRVRVYASEAPEGRVAGDTPRIFLGEYPGFVADYAGSQGQAGGRVVPINTAQETTDATRATRLWLLTRDKTARSVLSTFDFVSAYALNDAGDALAVSRRSISSPARGAFLWLYPVEPRSARRVGSLRRPGGSGPASALRPVAWGPGNKTIFATPFCDQCADNAERGLFVVSLADGSLRRLGATGDRTIFAPSFSADGSRFVYQEAARLPTCAVFERCEERRLIAVDIPSGRMRELAASTELSFDDPVISLDGSMIAYASGRGNEIVWRSFDSGKSLGAIDVGPSEEVVPVAWMSPTQLLVVGRTSSARPDGPSEGNLFRVTRAMLNDGSEAGAHIELIASDDTLTYLGWLR
jgi:hypothetical protein